MSDHQPPSDGKPETIKDLDDAFRRWHERFEPEPGWLRLRDAVAEYETIGLPIGMGDFLAEYDIPIAGRHMHAPGGPIPPSFLYEHWQVDVQGNWARERHHKPSWQNAVQVVIHQDAWERALRHATDEAARTSGPTAGDPRSFHLEVPNPGLETRLIEILGRYGTVRAPDETFEAALERGLETASQNARCVACDVVGKRPPPEGWKMLKERCICSACTKELLSDG